MEAVSPAQTAGGVRPLHAGDIDQVRLLWGLNVLDDLEILSYDRWGPGIAVPVDNDVDEVRVNTMDPKEGMDNLLHHLVDAPDCFCLVWDNDGTIHGYVVASVHDQGVNDFRSSRIDELFVREESRRLGIATQLVRSVMTELVRREAWVHKVEVASNWAAGRRFWAALGWEQDAVVFSLYS